MSLAEAKKQARNYTLVVVMLASAWLLSHWAYPDMVSFVNSAATHGSTLFILMSVMIVFTLGFFIYELAKPTLLPSFVLAIFFGMVSRDVLMLVVSSPTALHTLITIGAVYILFDGGLDVPFHKFKTLFAPVSVLSSVGLLMTAVLFSLALVPIAGAMGVAIPVPVAVLLGAALSSTDPAAIIPSFKSLLFLYPRVKHVAVSESAITDVFGAVLVGIFLALFQSDTEPTTVLGAYHALFTLKNLQFTVSVVGVGIVVGVIGFVILWLWNSWKQRVQTEGECDSALFLALPLFSFSMAELLGGSGYLAVFLSSLMFSIRSHFRHVQHYFNSTIEGFMKPLIFMLLGAMVDPQALWSIAPLGCIAGLLVLFVLRPIVVFTCLLPFMRKSEGFTLREVVFLSFVRETGVIPAALLISISVVGFLGSQTMLAIGLWVILLTLLIEPPLTPVVAKALGIARDMNTSPIRHYRGPVAVLCSRGFSFPDRMKTVVRWAQEHGVENIALLHCPEERYSKEFVADVRGRADLLFTQINERLESDGRTPIHFEFLCGPGLLQENIESLIAGGDVSIIFVGAKLLDYRIDDVKRLNVPFYFMP